MDFKLFSCAFKIRQYCQFFLFLAILVIVIPCSSATNLSHELIEYGSYLSNSGRLDFGGDIRCVAGDGSGTTRNINDPNSDTLFHVAREKYIVLFGHGFYPYPNRTKPPFTYIAGNTWGRHLDALRNNGQHYSSCLFLYDTAIGFGDPQTGIGRFLFALRALTDDAELYFSNRNIVMIGYSTGVNYLKQSLLTFQKHLAVNDIKPTGLRSTNMTFVFLGGPNQGSDITLSSIGAIRFIDNVMANLDEKPNSYRERSVISHKKYQKAERELLLSSRGMRQLKPGNRELEHLNRAFVSALTPNIRVLNFASETDFIAPPAKVQLPGIETLLVDKFSHWDFIAKPPDKRNLMFIKKLYSDKLHKAKIRQGKNLHTIRKFP